MARVPTGVRRDVLRQASGDTRAAARSMRQTIHVSTRIHDARVRLSARPYHGCTYVSRSMPTSGRQRYKCKLRATGVTIRCDRRRYATMRDHTSRAMTMHDSALPYVGRHDDCYVCACARAGALRARGRTYAGAGVRGGARGYVRRGAREESSPSNGGEWGRGLLLRTHARGAYAGETGRGAYLRDRGRSICRRAG